MSKRSWSAHTTPLVNLIAIGLLWGISARLPKQSFLSKPFFARQMILTTYSRFQRWLHAFWTLSMLWAHEVPASFVYTLVLIPYMTVKINVLQMIAVGAIGSENAHRHLAGTICVTFCDSWNAYNIRAASSRLEPSENFRLCLQRQRAHRNCPHSYQWPRTCLLIVVERTKVLDHSWGS